MTLSQSDKDQLISVINGLKYAIEGRISSEISDLDRDEYARSCFPSHNNEMEKAFEKFADILINVLNKE